MTRIAVVGATGFVGRHILNELNTREELSVVATSRRVSGDSPALTNGRWENLDIASPPPNLFDFLDRPDILIHLAWEGLPNYRSLHHFDDELPRQYAFIHDLVAQGLQSLVVTGTCFEYGMQSGALSEHIEAKPANPYGLAKDTLRRQLENLHQSESFNLTWARLFYTYGDGQAEGSLWPQLKRAVENGSGTFDMSGGEQLRDFLPITKLAKFLVQLAVNQQDVGIVNVCSGRPISVRNLVEGWIRDNDWSIALNLGHFPYPDYEPMEFWGDSRKLTSLTG